MEQCKTLGKLPAKQLVLIKKFPHLDFFDVDGGSESEKVSMRICGLSGQDSLLLSYFSRLFCSHLGSPSHRQVWLVRIMCTCRKKSAAAAAFLYISSKAPPPRLGLGRWLTKRRKKFLISLLILQENFAMKRYTKKFNKLSHIFRSKASLFLIMKGAFSYWQQNSTVLFRSKQY